MPDSGSVTVDDYFYSADDRTLATDPLDDDDDVIALVEYHGLQTFQKWYAHVHGYVATVICSWGVMANMANIVVLTRRSMLSPTNFILTWLAVADLLTMSTYIPFALHFYVMKDQRLAFPSTTSHGWIMFLMFNINFSVVCHTVAIWLTITLAVCRYVCIRYPTVGTTLCSLQNVKIAVVVVYIASIVACVPNYMTAAVAQKTYAEERLRLIGTDDDDNQQSLTVVDYYPTDIGATAGQQSETVAHPMYCEQICADLCVGNASASTTTTTSSDLCSDASTDGTCTCFIYYTVEESSDAVLNQVNYWIQAILFKLVPCVLLTTLTVLLLTVMRRANARRAKLKSQGRQDESERAREHNRTTAMLVTVVGLFQLTELPQGVLTLGSVFVSGFYENVYSPLGDLLDISALLNNSITFILYCSMSRQFRQTFIETLCGRRLN